MKLESIFKSISEKLKLDFRHMSSEIKHNFSKGNVREVELVEQFFKKYLPKTIGIGHGEIVTTSGDTSPESDVIFYENRSCPYFLDKTGYQIFPIECIYGVIEVKSNLNSCELKDCWEKIFKIKQFQKIAYEPQNSAVIKESRLYGKIWPYFPTIGMVFAYDSIDLVKLQKSLVNLQKDSQIHECIDSIWVLNKGMIINWDENKSIIEHTPTKTTRLRSMKSENPLLLMTVHLQQILQSGWMPQFKIREYLNNVVYGYFIEE